MFTRATVRTRALIGVAYLSAVGLVVGALVLQSQGAFRSKVDVIGTFASVGDGLPVGSDVKLRGVIVGRVSQVDARPGRFEVRMELKPDAVDQIPASVRARILPTNLFGAPFVDLRVVGPETPAIRSKAHVLEDTSVGSVQLQSVFQKVYDVLIAVKPAKLSVTLTAISDALQGNGDRIGQMITQAEAYVSDLNQHAGTFRQDLTRLADTLQGVQRATPDLLQAMGDASTLAKTLVEERQGLQQLFAAGIDAANTTGDFVHDQGKRIIRFLDLTGRFAGILAPIADGIDRSLVGLGDTAGRLATVAPGHDGPHIQGYLVTTDYPLYSAADCPRYGALAGPNCPKARAYGGTVGPVGSREEQRQLAEIAGGSDTSGLDSVLLGPVLRGETVVRR